MVWFSFLIREIIIELLGGSTFKKIYWRVWNLTNWFANWVKCWDLENLPAQFLLTQSSKTDISSFINDKTSSLIIILWLDLNIVFESCSNDTCDHERVKIII